MMSDGAVIRQVSVDRLLADKLDRQVVRHKEKLSAHRTDRGTTERSIGAAEPGPAD